MSLSDRRGLDDSAAWMSQSHPQAPRDLTGLTLGDFQVEKLLGRGGMGEVYLATQRSLNRPVALKVLRQDYASSSPYLARLRAEATAIARLNHPNIVHVYTLDEVEGLQFIAMEYVQGTNLRDYIRRKGSLDLPLALSVMRQTAQALGAAGEIGLVHRDVKPENILINKKGRVKVADFGLCRDADKSSGALTQPGVTMGTPLYMSPEQSQGHPVDHRSDLYSLGVTFYQMLAGEPPFQGDSPIAIALKHIREAPRSLQVYRPDLPPEVDRVVLKLLRKTPEDRYQSAAELLVDLNRLREVLPTAPQPAAADPGAGRLERTAADPDLEPAPDAAAENPSAAQTRLGLSGSGSAQAAVVANRPRVSVFAGFLLGLVALAAGAGAGYATRSPELQALAAAESKMPGLWLEPRWKNVPKQAGAQEQYRFAQLLAPREDWAAAWLAVPGHFSHSHEVAYKAYTQLVRIYYRRHDVAALEALEAELAVWKNASRRDQELLEMLRIAIKNRKGDLEGVVDGIQTFTRAGVTDIFDPGLLELGLEICMDAAQSVGVGAQTIAREPLVASQRVLLRRLYRIEVRQQPARKAAGAAGRSPEPGTRPLSLHALEDRIAWPI